MLIVCPEQIAGLESMLCELIDKCPVIREKVIIMEDRRPEQDDRGDQQDELPVLCPKRLDFLCYLSKNLGFHNAQGKIIS